MPIPPSFVGVGGRVGVVMRAACPIPAAGMSHAAPMTGSGRRPISVSGSDRRRSFSASASAHWP